MTKIAQNSKPSGTKLAFICSCEGTCPQKIESIAAGLESSGKPATLIQGADFCRSEADRLTKALSGAREITITCKQEEPLFRQILDENGYTGEARFVDIRALAGWSVEGEASSPKAAALIAAAELPAPALPFITMESQGVALIYGRDELAIDVGHRLSEALDVTVMLTRPGAITPPRRTEFPVVKGTIRQAKGYLGAFELTIDDFAIAAPSSRNALLFGTPKNGAISKPDLVIDLSGAAPLFSADSLRDGYLRCDPNDKGGIEALIAKAREMIGTFDKPKYISFKPDLCAHARSKITGCTRCLEVCPTGAITPGFESVAIDPYICAGCGGCASVCPTGAASYALPGADDLMRQIRTLLRAYHGAGGTAPALLFHDQDHGLALIDALARFGDGLPARVIPVQVNEVTQIGIEQVAAAFSYGASAIGFLTRAKPKHDLLPLERMLALGAALLPAFGYAPEALSHIATDDPDALIAALRALPGSVEGASIASFLPQGGKRQIMSLALREWRNHAPLKPERIALEKGAPFGRVLVDQAGCTLCLSCVSTCPVDALSANSERPELKFQEDLCVQCGLCAATCPEKVITLEPRLDFLAINAPPIILKEEEPYPCDCCGKLFGTKSTVEKIKAKLGGAHWMFSGPNADRIKLIGYCDDCRIAVATEQNFDPYAGPPRPNVRTSEDYFRERQEDQDK